MRKFFILVAISLNLLYLKSFAQDTQISVPDSLMEAREMASNAEIPQIDLEIARYYFLKNNDSLEHYINVLSSHLDSKYDLNIDAYLNKFKGFICDYELEPDSALSHKIRSYALFREMGDLNEMGWLAKSIGKSYFRFGNFASATEQFFLALSHFEEISYKLGVAEVYNDLGRVAYTSEHPGKALEYFKSALDIFNKYDYLEDWRTYKIYNNLGLIYNDQENYDLALEYYMQAANGFKSNENFHNYASVLGNISMCYVEKEMLDTALFYIRKSDHYAEAVDYKFGLIVNKINQGYLMRLFEDYDSALIYLYKGLEGAKESQLEQFVEASYKELADLFADMNNYDSAFNYLSLYNDLHTKMVNEKSQKRIEELMLSYEKQIREAELLKFNEDRKLQNRYNKIYLLLLAIALMLTLSLIYGYANHKKKNKELEQKNKLLEEVNQKLANSEQKLKSMVEDKNQLFSIIAHDLRNPVAAVSGFSELLADNFDQLSNENRKEYAEQIVEGSHRTYTLLENLLLWVRSQMNTLKVNKEDIKVSTLIEASSVSILSALNRKNLKMENIIEEDFILNVDIEMIKVVIRNLLTNAIKFSFPGNKLIIKAYKNKEQNCVEISDFGLGIQPEIIPHLFSPRYNATTPGTSGEAGSGLGLLICKEYTEKNNGTISVKSEVGKGSTFTICLP